MSEHTVDRHPSPVDVREHITEQRLGAVGWGLFFIWIGIAFMQGISPGIGLLGIGLITLGVQMLRKLFGLTFEGFWIGIGLLFTLGGFWSLYQVSLPLIPILLVVGGLLLLMSVFRSKF